MDGDSPTTPSYEGPERRSTDKRSVESVGREVFELAVTTATKAATQEVARIHRVRLVTQAGLAAFLAAVIVAIGVAYALTSSQSSQDRTNAITNCQLVKDLTGSMGDFVQSDARLRREQAAFNRSQQVIQPFKKLFHGNTLARLQQKSAALDRATFGYWQTVIIPRLRRVGAGSCSTGLK